VIKLYAIRKKSVIAFSFMCLLSACGGGGDTDGDTVTVVPSSGTAGTTADDSTVGTTETTSDDSNAGTTETTTDDSNAGTTGTTTDDSNADTTGTTTDDSNAGTTGTTTDDSTGGTSGTNTDGTAIVNLGLNPSLSSDFARLDGLSVIGDIEDDSLQLSFDGPGGLANACAEDSDIGSSWYWQLPLEFTGDISSSLNNNLSFQLRGSDSPNSEQPIVVLVARNGTVYHHLPVTYPGTEWVNYEVSIAPGSFNIAGTNTQPTPAQFSEDLTGIVDILILGDYRSSTASDSACISDVSLPRIQTDISYGLIESFDNSNNGFGGVSGTEAVEHVLAGGAPDSHVCLEDAEISASAYWASSVEFLGDWSALFGEELHYRVRSSSNGTDVFATTSVLLTGDGITLVANESTTPSQYWRNTRVPLVPEHWRIWIDGEPTDQPSDAVFRQVLSDVNQFYIPADFRSRTATDSACLDSVGLTGSLAQKSPAVYIADFDSGAEGWSIGTGAENLSTNIAGGISDGHICAEDDSIGDRWLWIAPPELLGQLNSSSQELIFYRKKDSSQTTSADSVLLESASGNLIYAENFAPDDSWKATRVPLQSNSAWVFEGTSQMPSMVQFQQVLDSVAALKIFGDFDSSTATDSSCLDAVQLR